MNRRFIIGFLLAPALIGCQAKDAPAGRVSVSEAASSVYGKLTESVRTSADAIKSSVEPRKVRRGAKPELIIRGHLVTYDGRPLELGKSIAEWRNVIGGSPRRSPEQQSVYVWDELGLQVLTAKSDGRVTQLAVFVNLEPKDSGQDLFTTNPDGSPAKKVPDLRPLKSFSGYLELDGYGIDAKSRFSEIRRSADPARRLKCGTLDCSHPVGVLGEDGAGIYLRLAGGREDDVLYEFTINK